MEERISGKDPIDLAIWKAMQDGKYKSAQTVATLLNSYGFRSKAVLDRFYEIAQRRGNRWFTHRNGRGGINREFKLIPNVARPHPLDNAAGHGYTGPMAEGLANLRKQVRNNSSLPPAAKEMGDLSIVQQLEPELKPLEFHELVRDTIGDQCETLSNILVRLQMEGHEHLTLKCIQKHMERLHGMGLIAHYEDLRYGDGQYQFLPVEGNLYSPSKTLGENLKLDAVLGRLLETIRDGNWYTNDDVWLLMQTITANVRMPAVYDRLRFLFGENIMESSMEDNGKYLMRINPNYLDLVEAALGRTCFSPSEGLVPLTALRGIAVDTAIKKLEGWSTFMLEKRLPVYDQQASEAVSKEIQRLWDTHQYLCGRTVAQNTWISENVHPLTIIDAMKLFAETNGLVVRDDVGCEGHPVLAKPKPQESKEFVIDSITDIKEEPMQPTNPNSLLKLATEYNERHQQDQITIVPKNLTIEYTPSINGVELTRQQVNILRELYHGSLNERLDGAPYDLTVTIGETCYYLEHVINAIQAFDNEIHNYVTKAGNVTHSL